MSELVLEKNRELPDNWIQTSIETIAHLQGGYAFKSKDYTESGRFVLRTINIDKNGLLNHNNPVFLPNSLLEKYKKYELMNEDILFVMVGATMGKVGFVTNSILPALLNQNMWLIRSNQINSKFLFYTIKYLSKSFLDHSVGTARSFVKRGDFKELKINIAPLNEQKRIVEKIEEILSKISENESLLKSLSLKIPILRNSLLKNMFSGVHTEEWRKTKKISITKEKLSAQVFSEVSKFKKNIVSGYLTNVPQFALPDSWIYLNLDSLTSKIVDGTHFSPNFIESGIYFISAKDIKNGRIHFDTCKFISKEEHDELSKRCNPELGDVLMSKSGTIGRTAVVDTNKTFSLCESASLLKPLSNLLSPKYLSWYLEFYVKLHILNQGLRGVGVQHFQLIDIKKIPIPLTTLDEQKEIVKDLEFQLNKLDYIYNQIQNWVSIYSTITQSVLKQAFEGKLVPQDPNDEPAEILLEKIKQEQQLIQKQKPSKRKKNVK